MRNFVKALIVFIAWAVLGILYLKHSNAFAELSPEVVTPQVVEEPENPNDFKYIPNFEDELAATRAEIIDTMNEGNDKETTNLSEEKKNDESIYTDNSLMVDEINEVIAEKDKETTLKSTRERTLQLTRETENSTPKINRELGEMVYPSYSYGELVVDQNLNAISSRIENLLKENQDTNVIIIGHTDNVGNAVDNYLIALQRARQIKWYLTNELNLSGKRIKATSKGETEPLASNSNAKGRKKNNRIEIIVQ